MNNDDDDDDDDDNNNNNLFLNPCEHPRQRLLWEKVSLQNYTYQHT